MRATPARAHWLDSERARLVRVLSELSTMIEKLRGVPRATPHSAAFTQAPDEKPWAASCWRAALRESAAVGGAMPNGLPKVPGTGPAVEMAAPLAPSLTSNAWLVMALRKWRNHV